MSILFTPAARLLSRVNYPVKFAFLLLLCALPIAVLSTIVFSNIQSEIEDMSQEQRGLRYINELRSLLGPVNTTCDKMRGWKLHHRISKL
ncbi:MAG: hypothetical protein OQL20_00510 [Sedimenticola sp.]|nr:hypothetical protein [Sedimenticola sp.]